MASTFSSHVEALVSRPIDLITTNNPARGTKLPFSEVYSSSYGESEDTPTPKPRKIPRHYSNSSFSSRSSSPNLYTTSPAAQAPRDVLMEDSGDESDDVYDQFDLGDFTKEEIKIYESMVGPGERLRDAAPPKKSLVKMLETSYQRSRFSSHQQVRVNNPVRVLPEELYELVHAGISNAIERAFSVKSIAKYDWTKEALEDIFMDEVSRPFPQIIHFIRSYPFPWSDSVPPHLRREARRQFISSPRSPEAALRQFEQDVYDFSRNLGLPMNVAEEWVFKAQEFWSEKGSHSTNSEEKEGSKRWNCMLDQSSKVASAEIFRLPLVPVEHSDPAPQGITSAFQANGSPELAETPAFNVSEAPASVGYSSSQDENKIDDIVHSVTENEFEGAKQVHQNHAQNLKLSRCPFEDDKDVQTSLEPPVLDDESAAVEVAEGTEAVVNEKEKKAAKKAAKKARKAKSKGNEDATRQSEKTERRKEMLELDEKEKPPIQKKKGRKRKRDPELPLQSGVQLEINHQYKKSKLDSEGTSSKKIKAKERGPHYSPFFQRSNDPKASKSEIAVEAKLPMGFQAPMIHLEKKGTPMVPTSPPSNDSSPLSSLRSTPSLPTFDNTEFKREKARIRQLSNVTHLPTPTSSPISLQELNKRILEGTIYQDGITLVKAETLVTLAVPKKARKRLVTVSRFFAKPPPKKPKASDKISCVPFPPLHARSFGLVQERLSHDPFRLLIAVIFLNKTRGSVALPVFYKLMDRYPTPVDLAAAKQEDVVAIIQHLGLQNQRAKKCISLANAWLARPPEKGKRYRVLHYPKRDDGRDVAPNEVIDEQDSRVAWEIGQLPGIGVYALDSWRIFCRDSLLGLPSGLPPLPTKDLATKEEELQKEWTRVLAGDKELRAYLRWRWLRNGWDWDPVTGERKVADESALARADKGGVIYEGEGGDVVLGNAKVEAVKAELGEDGVQADDPINDDTVTERALPDEKSNNE